MRPLAGSVRRNAPVFLSRPLETVYPISLLGIDPRTEIPDRLGRRFPIAGEGIVRPKLLG